MALTDGLCWRNVASASFMGASIVTKLRLYLTEHSSMKSSTSSNGSFSRMYRACNLSVNAALFLALATACIKWSMAMLSLPPLKATEISPFSRLKSLKHFSMTSMLFFTLFLNWESWREN